MANSTNIYERLLLHKWFAMLIWWKAQSLNLSIKASRKKDGKLKGISKYSIIEKKSHLNFFFRNGCATSEDLFYKLDALQSFIRDLHWPDPEFAEHLNQRLKMMACDMIDSCIKRTDASFQNHLKKGILLNPTDYIVPTEICAMINVVLDAKNQSFKLCAVDGVDVVRLFLTNLLKWSQWLKITKLLTFQYISMRVLMIFKYCEFLQSRIFEEVFFTKRTALQ